MTHVRAGAAGTTRVLQIPEHQGWDALLHLNLFVAFTGENSGGGRKK